MDEIDKLLTELQQEFSENKPNPQLSNLHSTKPNTSKSAKANYGIDKLLDDVKADFEQQDLAQQLQRQQEIETQRIRQEELKQKQKEALKQEAKIWLEKLDPLSTEGMWFERFAEGYSSKLDAAVEYLQGLES